MRLRVLATCIAMTAWIAAPAAAHTELTGTNPPDGSVITAPQAAITLTFSEPPLAEGTAVVVTDSSGRQLPAGQVTIDGANVNAPWPQSLAPGRTTVAWRAASDDGHVVSGTFVFDYTPTDEPPSPMPVTLPSETAVPSSGLTGGAAVAIAVLIIGAGAVALLAKRR